MFSQFLNIQVSVCKIVNIMQGLSHQAQLEALEIFYN